MAPNETPNDTNAAKPQDAASARKGGLFSKLLSKKMDKYSQQDSAKENAGNTNEADKGDAVIEPAAAPAERKPAHDEPPPDKIPVDPPAKAAPKTESAPSSKGAPGNGQVDAQPPAVPAKAGHANSSQPSAKKLAGGVHKPTKGANASAPATTDPTSAPKTTPSSGVAAANLAAPPTVTNGVRSVEQEEDILDLDADLNESAISAVVELLFKRISSDRRLTRYAPCVEPLEVETQLRRFVLGRLASDTGLVPEAIAPLLDGPVFDGLIDALMDAARRPLPLGEDVLVVAISTLCGEMRNDKRVLRFADHVRGAPGSADGRDSDPEVAAIMEEAQPRSHAAPMPAPAVAPTDVDVLEDPDEPEADATLAPDIVGASEAGINVRTLDTLELDAEMVQEAQSLWTVFCNSAQSREAVGEMIYNALFESAPSLQALFTTPRAVQAMRFMNGLHGFITALDDPVQLKILVETLGFGHLHLDVTPPRVVIFRDALMELFEVEAGDKFSKLAREGWLALLNYVGGAIIFVKAHYAERLNVLCKSWELANDKGSGKPSLDKQDSIGSLEMDEIKVGSGEAAKKEGTWASMKRGRDKLRRQGSPTAADESAKKDSNGEQAAGHNDATSGNKLLQQGVPTTFVEMFDFNAAVMGISNRWFAEIINSFDAIVRNVANSARLQEECEVVSLRISRVTRGQQVHLYQYKSCMLAALRSLLPKVWDGTYEVAWGWLWENVERILSSFLGKPAEWEAHLGQVMNSLDEKQKYELRKQIYIRFFQLAPAGQDFFKQSDTRLHFIAERIMDFTVEILRDPWGLVTEISALGLRHVGYGIPTELIGPFVTVSIQVFSSYCENDKALEAFRWTLGLIAKILVRTITEGSTIVMKAINANSVKALRKAVSCAPRGNRAEWLLNVQVGTQQISPLSWAIESGRLDAATAVITDLLTIRADRERYYFGVDELFERHPDIVKRLCDEAAILLPTLTEGLVWRSRHTKGGLRRVNYYVKHLVINKDGQLSDALRSLAASKDTAMISHPVIVLVSDTLWTGVVRRQFILSKVGFLFSLTVFMLSQAILPKTAAEEERAIRITIFVGRVVNYLFSMSRLFFQNAKRIWEGYHNNDMMRVFGIPVPRYLHDPYALLGFLLLMFLIAMCAHEPMFYCAGHTEQWPTEMCEQAEAVEFRYTLCSMCAMVIHWLLLIDMAVFATKLAAFVLVCRHVLSEVGRFLVAMLFLLATFSSAITCLRHEKIEFQDIPSCANALFAVTVGLYEGDYRELQHEPALLTPVLLFVTVSGVVLINLLIAQLNCSYEYVYQDMVGFARLTRAQLLVDTLQSCSPARWKRFVSTLRFDQNIEFDEGDIGLAGGIQVKEPASSNPMVKDLILRFGGACSPIMQWPEERGAEEEDRFDRVERLMQLALKRVTKGHPSSKDGGKGSKGSKGSKDDVTGSEESASMSDGQENSKEE